MESQDNMINEAIIKGINNPFLINSLSQSIINKINISGPFKIPNNIEGPYESQKTSLVSKDRLKQKRATMESDDDIEELSDKEDKTKKIKKRKKIQNK